MLGVDDGGHKNIQQITSFMESYNNINQNGKIKLMFGDGEVNEFSQNEVKLLR